VVEKRIANGEPVPWQEVYIRAPRSKKYTPAQIARIKKKNPNFNTRVITPKVLGGETMDVNKWKSIAVDIESYTIIRAMGANGLRNPGNMIKKMVSDSIKKIAKKEGLAEPRMKENLLSQGKKLLK
jgi:hypothetical protein